MHQYRLVPVFLCPNLQTQIEKAEKEDHDAKKRGSMAASVKKYAAAEVKKQFAALKKCERAKGLGRGKDQPWKPTDNGQKQARASGRSPQASKRSPRSSSWSSINQQGGQRINSARKTNQKKRGTSKESSSRTSTMPQRAKTLSPAAAPRPMEATGKTDELVKAVGTMHVEEEKSKSVSLDKQTRQLLE